MKSTITNNLLVMSLMCTLAATEVLGAETGADESLQNYADCLTEYHKNKPIKSMQDFKNFIISCRSYRDVALGSEHARHYVEPLENEAIITLKIR